MIAETFGTGRSDGGVEVIGTGSSLTRNSVPLAVRTIAAIAVVMMVAAVPADAEGTLADFTLSAGTVDPRTGIGHVSVNVKCVDPAGFIRTRFVATQSRGQNQPAVSLDVGAAFGCSAGEIVTMRVQFGGQQGSFRPGPATFEGFVHADATMGGSTIGSVTFTRTLVLRPE